MMTQRPSIRRAAGFTLVELLMVMSIVTLVATTVLVTMYRANQQARAARTRSQLAKVNELLMLRWEGYRSRPLPMRIPARLGNENAKAYALRVQRTRLAALRDLMRMEMPERMTDVLDLPAVPGLASPSVRNAYLMHVAQAGGNWTPQFQQAECLYLILSTIRDGETTALDFFKPSEIGDVDADGMREVLDGWGTPLVFLRWAPGFLATPGPDGFFGVANVDDDNNGNTDDSTEAGWPGSDDLQASLLQKRVANAAGDPMDTRRVDPNASAQFALYPLVASAGEDKEIGIYICNQTAFHYNATFWAPGMRINPYALAPPPDPNASGPLKFPTWIGAIIDPDHHNDNIYSHNLDTRATQ